MNLFIYGLILFIFLALPPVAELAESIMAIHMHMQMPLFAVAGILMTPFLQRLAPNFFRTWNKDGIPGLLLALVVISYWLIPRAMDDALIHYSVELFKFFSWTFLVGVPLMDSWKKLSLGWKRGTFLFLTVAYTIMAFVYIFAEEQLCNNYLVIEQQTLGWSFLFIAICIFLYFMITFFERESDENPYFEQ
ncbi:MAG TPA: hypothetical protein VK037_03885 [Pseudogracilibacillus sp.]|nr:hypothetical protein [Pseudogracilibacillus sp.]